MKFTTSSVVAAFCAFGSVVATIGDGDVGAASVVTAYPLGMLNDEFVCEKRWKVKHVKEHAKFASKYIPTADGAAANGAPNGWPKEFNTTDDHILHGCSGVVYQWPLTEPDYTEGATVGSDFLLVEADYAGDKIELCNAVTTGANGDLVECDHHRSEY
ncbi:putative ribosomal protein l28 l40 mitochondrial protein [Neofusicoccum parvum]|uniref:Ribosomal protein l28 l40 mitochondrial protein n=2 Tax=Neofusicoccum parvum TaxID=310453 RepID=A0ACB5S6M6_9PEZI|nr:putative ribosomal protein l28 l40 mitochondrial protein [Neofusicoccum parvum UCRNP2]GME28331.1 putative ribosomal protein l28 l40 mitochondrial protein [Neofusicoccum parvum]GME58367.1 putative ribosomal protein l28 l40 mitochondrial protein [Neofusicoccum parvum]